MRPLDKNAVSALNKQFDFYDFNSYSSGNDLQIVFTEEFGAVRFGDLEYGAEPNEYQIREALLCELTHRIMKRFSDSEIVLKKYEDSWIVNKDLSQELYKELGKHHIDKNVSAISLDKTSPWITLFIKAALKYNSFFEFLLPSKKIVLTLTDHMDIFISAENEIILQEIDNIVEEVNQGKLKIFKVLRL